jgi:hypothetical protein
LQFDDFLSKCQCGILLQACFLFLFCRSVQEDVSVDTVILNGDKQGTDQNSSVDKTEASVADFEAVRIM